MFKNGSNGPFRSSFVGRSALHPFVATTKSDKSGHVQVNTNNREDWNMYSKPAIASQMNLEGSLKKKGGGKPKRPRGSGRR